MAIMMAFQTPTLDILGLTTVFGNVSTQDATRNALLLVCTNCIIIYVLKMFLGCVLSSLSFMQKNSVRLLASLMSLSQKEVLSL